MKRQDGIALIASLLIMAAIMALGAGSLFLTTMNLRVAENSRTYAVAHYNAEAGMEVALVKLKKDFKSAGQFPVSTDFKLPTSLDSAVTYKAIGSGSKYTRYSATQAQVIIAGEGPNGALYQTEVLVSAAPGINEALLKGLVSEAPIRVTGGGSAEFINAAVHSNVSVDMPGHKPDGFKNCPDPASATGCVTANPVPVSSSTTDCSISGCTKNASKIDVAPEYIVKRNDAIAKKTFGLIDYLVNGQKVSDGQGGYLYANPTSPTVPININPEVNASVYTGRCTVVYSNINRPPTTITSVSSGAKICAKDGLSLNFSSNINMTDATIIADGNITFGGANTVNGVAGTLNNTKLISRTRNLPLANLLDLNDGVGGVMLDTVTGKNLTLFTGANRDVSNGADGAYYNVGQGFNLSGDTTIASNRNIKFDGKTQLTTPPGKKGEVTTAVISTRKIDNNGSSNFYGVFWAGQCFSQNGSSTIYGSVTVEGTSPACGTAKKPGDTGIDIRGKLKINTGYGISNSAISDGNAGVEVLSRR